MPVAAQPAVAMPDDAKKAALYEAAERLARSRVRLDGLIKAVDENHSMRVEEQRIYDERRVNFLALCVESGLKFDRDELLREIAPVEDPRTRDETVRTLMVAFLLEASASDLTKKSEPG